MEEKFVARNLNKNRATSTSRSMQSDHQSPSSWPSFVEHALRLIVRGVRFFCSRKLCDEVSPPLLFHSPPPDYLLFDGPNKKHEPRLMSEPGAQDERYLPYDEAHESELGPRGLRVHGTAGSGLLPGRSAKNTVPHGRPTAAARGGRFVCSLLWRPCDEIGGVVMLSLGKDLANASVCVMAHASSQSA